ncbi:MAG TPA: hypothetical protein VGE83_10760 [Terracidiphilus sp.]|jgi:hypothetical protein
MEERGFIQRHTAKGEHGTMTGAVQLPAPTAWPMVLALGIALMLAGMVTHWAISLLGLLLALRAIWGWFFEVLPHEHHVSVPVHDEIIAITSIRTTRERLPGDVLHRKLLPVETFSVTAGIKGGIAGGFAMLVPAALYGLIRYHSVWYAVNLLAAGGFVSWAGQSNAFLAQFHIEGLLAAAVIHALASVLIGLLYGAMLPMFPWKPILTAGFIAPLLWTGILYSAIGVISPILDARINWLWFVLSQIAFGLVCGFVVNLQVKVRTPQFQALPFSVRAGLHGDQIETKDDKK